MGNNMQNTIIDSNQKTGDLILPVTSGQYHVEKLLREKLLVKNSNP